MRPLPLEQAEDAIHALAGETPIPDDLPEKLKEIKAKKRRSYWIPGSYAPALSENRNSFLRLLKNKGFKEERMTKVGVYAIG